VSLQSHITLQFNLLLPPLLQIYPLRKLLKISQGIPHFLRHVHDSLVSDNFGETVNQPEDLRLHANMSLPVSPLVFSCAAASSLRCLGLEPLLVLADLDTFISHLRVNFYF
jgi:hypothetical protein